MPRFVTELAKSQAHRPALNRLEPAVCAEAPREPLSETLRSARLPPDDCEQEPVETNDAAKLHVLLNRWKKQVADPEEVGDSIALARRFPWHRVNEEVHRERRVFRTTQNEPTAFLVGSGLLIVRACRVETHLEKPPQKLGSIHVKEHSLDRLGGSGKVSIKQIRPVRVQLGQANIVAFCANVANDRRAPNVSEPRSG